MVLTDTSGTAFDKVSMNIVGLLQTKADMLVYTHDTRFAYQIFNGGAIQASNIIRNN